MNSKIYHVEAIWDQEAQVWVATSDDVPGLATEAASLDLLITRLRVLIPELLEANRQLDPERVQSLAFELTTRRHEEVRLAS